MRLDPAQVGFSENDHVIEAFPADRADGRLSTYAFCQGDRNAIGRSRMPMARRRYAKTGPDVARSRMRYRGAWSRGKTSVIWREIPSAVESSLMPNDSQIRHYAV